MSSFYGGKEGRTYHIVQRYDSVHDMVNAFSGGGAYTDANYGQYVIIDTVLNQGRSASKENGLLYRRGFDYNDPEHEKPVKTADMSDEDFQQAWANWVQDPGAGAIYVGQIVGPEGRTPELHIEQWEDFDEQIGEDGNFGSKEEIAMDPTATGKQRDTVKVGYINIVDSHGDVTGGYIAFDIPELVVEAEVVDSDAYSAAGVIEDDSSEGHPFWYKWNFTIPNGKRGADLNGLAIETGEQTGQQEDAEGNPIVSDDRYLTYSIKDYQESAAGAVTAHLGRWPYRVIDDITFTNQNRIINDWSHGVKCEVGDIYRAEGYLQDLYWVNIKAGYIIDSDEVWVDPDGKNHDPSHDATNFPDLLNSEAQIGSVINAPSGETSWRAVKIPSTAPACSLIISYTAGEDDQFLIRSIDHFSVDDNGNLYAFYSDDINQSYLITNIGGLRSVSLDDQLGIVFEYTNGNTVNFELKQISSIDFYTQYPPVYDEQGNLAQNSDLKIRYKDGDVDTFEVKRIDNIIWDNSLLTASQNVIVNYLGGESRTATTSPINMVTAIGRKGDNILVLYSDPAVRESIPSDKKVTIQSWTDPVTGTSYENLEWYNFGQLGAQYHIQGEYDISDLKGDSTDPNFTIDLSQGFTGDLEDRMGWLVTLTDGQGNKRLYAFDYNDDPNDPSHELYDSTPSCWYEIMELSASMINPDRVMAISSINDPPTSLVDNGYWFVESYGHDTTY